MSARLTAPAGGWSLSRDSGGELSFVADDGGSLTLRRATDGWIIEGGPARARVERVARPPGGLLWLEQREDGVVERARLTPLSPDTENRLPADLLLEDGRLFRIEFCGGREARYEARCWETPAAYLVGRLAEQGWRIEPTIGGAEVEAIGAIALMLAVTMEADESSA